MTIFKLTSQKRVSFFINHNIKLNIIKKFVRFILLKKLQKFRFEMLHLLVIQFNRCRSLWGYFNWRATKIYNKRRTKLLSLT